MFAVLTEERVSRTDATGAALATAKRPRPERIWRSCMTGLEVGDENWEKAMNEVKRCGNRITKLDDVGFL